MPTDGLLLDTGPLVAYLSPEDGHHVWARVELARHQGPIYTCEAVLAEAFHLLRKHALQLRALETMLLDNVFDLTFSIHAEARSIVALRQKYSNVPMSLADACLVRLAELWPKLPLLTTDSDFQIYRRQRDRPLTVIVPDRA